MTNSPDRWPEDDRLSWLTERQMKGELSRDEKAELVELLDNSEEAQRRFVELAEFETALVEAHQSTSPQLSVEIYERGRGLALARTIIPWIVAAVCVVFVVWPKTNNGDAPRHEDGSPESLAKLVNRVDATFASPRPANDVSFDPGIYELQKGAVHLRFDNGADLVIESPARFELIDSLHTRLDYGSVRAIVPPAAKGFTITTQSAHFEDLGTEFGLRVNRESGDESLLVFDGQVNVRRPDSNELVGSILGGQSFQYIDGQPTEPGDMRPETFSEPDDIGFRHWQTATQARLQDTGLLALFSFQHDVKQPTVLRNLQTDQVGVVSDARIHGAHWGSGRWQGKDALSFDSQNHFAELDVTGDFNELTIAAWVVANRPDNPLNAVFDSNGWESGDIHLQITRKGNVYTDLYETRHQQRQRRNVVVPLAEWTHLVATWSLVTGKTRVFVNGERAFECSLNQDSRIRPGTCRIGNWLPVGEFDPVRSFNGRIDELAIWSRSLSEVEISAEMRRGQPNFLWRNK